jgi:hypothetical protein
MVTLVFDCVCSFTCSSNSISLSSDTFSCICPLLAAPNNISSMALALSGFTSAILDTVSVRGRGKERRIDGRESGIPFSMSLQGIQIINLHTTYIFL